VCVTTRSPLLLTLPSFTLGARAIFLEPQVRGYGLICSAQYFGASAAASSVIGQTVAVEVDHGAAGRARHARLERQVVIVAAPIKPGSFLIVGDSRGDRRDGA